MRVILDTNILISALLFKKRLAKIGDLIEQGTVIPCFIQSTREEVENTFHSAKFIKALNELGITAEDILQALWLNSLNFINPEIIPKVVSSIGDNNILAAALSANAECIVTGDKGLLNLKVFYGIPIFSTTEFLNKLH